MTGRFGCVSERKIPSVNWYATEQDEKNQAACYSIQYYSKKIDDRWWWAMTVADSFIPKGGRLPFPSMHLVLLTFNSFYFSSYIQIGSEEWPLCLKGNQQ